MSRPPMVALIGVDGSGKTTQARLLARWLSESGRPASYFENGGGRPLLDPLARRMGRRDGPDLLGRGYVVVESAIRSAAIARALLLSRVTGRIAVLDRYSYCQYALMRARGPGRGGGDERRVRGLFGRFPTPDVVCLLSAPPLIAQERVERRGRDHEELDYLVAFDNAYRSLPEAGTFRIVPAQATTDEVQAELRKIVMAVLPS